MFNLMFNRTSLLISIVILAIVFASSLLMVKRNKHRTAQNQVKVQELSSQSLNSSESVRVDNVVKVHDDSSSTVTSKRTVEKFRQDGSLESRETEDTHVVKVSKKATDSVSVSVASKSLSIEKQDSLVADSSSSVVLSEIVAEDSSSGIGPIVWTTIDGSYAGLSYRIIRLPVVGVTTSAVVGTNLGALPNMDISVGGFLSKEISPSLELGVVLSCKVPTLEQQIGLGVSYQF